MLINEKKLAIKLGQLPTGTFKCPLICYLIYNYSKNGNEINNKSFKIKVF